MQASFEEACKKVAEAKRTFDQEKTTQSVNEVFAELRVHAKSGM